MNREAVSQYWMLRLFAFALFLSARWPLCPSMQAGHVPGPSCYSLQGQSQKLKAVCNAVISSTQTVIILLYSLSGNTYQICPSFYHNINANLDNTVKSNPEQRN
jgi:hypothetical protein